MIIHNMHYSNTIVSARVFIGTMDTGQMDYTNRHDVKGCREAPIAKISQGVLA